MLLTVLWKVFDNNRNMKYKIDYHFKIYKNIDESKYHFSFKMDEINYYFNNICQYDKKSLLLSFPAVSNFIAFLNRKIHRKHKRTFTSAIEYSQ